MEDESDGVECFFYSFSPETVDNTIQGESAIESQDKIASMYTCRLIIISRVYDNIIIHVHGNVIICLAVFIPL